MIKKNDNRKYLFFGLVLLGVLTLGWVLKSHFSSHHDKTFSFLQSGKRAVAADDEGVPLCISADNIVGSSLIGTWVEDTELSGRLANPKEEAVPIHEIVFVPNIQVTTFFNVLRTLGKCAYLAGDMTVTVTKNGKKNTFITPFVLSENSGNPTLFIDEKWNNNNNQVADLHNIFVMLAKSTDTSKDILFVGGDSNDEDMRALIRK